MLPTCRSMLSARCLSLASPVMSRPRTGALFSTTTRYLYASDDKIRPAMTATPSDSDITQGLSDLFSTSRKNDRSTSSRAQQKFPSEVIFLRKEKPKSGPFETYSGRTKPVQQGDIAAAFKSLNNTLRNNNVAKHYRTQKFYEKPSDKRVRLNRERHRKRFLLGVKRLVNLVKEQRKFT